MAAPICLLNLTVFSSSELSQSPDSTDAALFKTLSNSSHQRDCGDARCRRARSCQDHECYWRRLQKLPTTDEMSRVRERAEPWTKLLRVGSIEGSQGRMRY